MLANTGLGEILLRDYAPRPLYIGHNLRPVVSGFAGLGQYDITGGICTDASGNATPCQGVIPPPATGSGYQQWASGAITTAPGPLPGTPGQWSLSIPGASGAPIGSGNDSGGSNVPGPSGKCIFGTSAIAQTMCGAGFWLVALGLVLALSVFSGGRGR